MPTAMPGIGSATHLNAERFSLGAAIEVVNVPFKGTPEALADAELLALQLGSGVRGKSAIQVAREMLAAYGSLADVAGREVAELTKLSGVGPAKAARLVAAFELTRRLRARVPGARVTLSGPAEVYAAYGPLMEDLKREVFRIALLDAQNGLLLDRVISQGTLSASQMALAQTSLAGGQGPLMQEELLPW